MLDAAMEEVLEYLESPKAKGPGNANKRGNKHWIKRDKLFASHTSLFQLGPIIKRQGRKNNDGNNFKRFFYFSLLYMYRL